MTNFQEELINLIISSLSSIFFTKLFFNCLDIIINAII